MHIFCLYQSTLGICPKFLVPSVPTDNGKSPILTARKRSLGQGNVFTPVCHSVAQPPWMQMPPGLGRPPLDADPPGLGTPPGCNPPPYGKQAGGPHPTGMYTCLFCRYHMLKKAEDIGRIRRNIIMFAVTIVAVIVTIFVGRTQQGTGQSVSEVQLREIQRLREEGLREETARKSANN